MRKFILAAFATLSLIACDKDEERIVISEEIPEDKEEEVVEFTSFQVNYTFSASDDVRDFYHFLIGYMDLTCQQHIDTLKGSEWTYATAPLSLVEVPDTFVCIVRMERKDDVPELTKYAYTLSYEQDISVTLSNADGSEIRTFDAGPMTSWSWQASPSAWAEWLVLHTNATLIDFRLGKSAFPSSK